jgi:hypothetical protein
MKAVLQTPSYFLSSESLANKWQSRGWWCIAYNPALGAEAGGS